MRKKKIRSPKNRIAGDFKVSTGRASFVADPLRDGGYTLELNKVPSSYVVIGAPRVLDFEYMMWIADAVRERRLDGASFVHLGGGACNLGRYFADVWPDSDHTVVEIDDQLIALVRETIDIPTNVKFKAAEARTFTHAIPANSVDVLIRDVFAGPDTPPHLTTVEFFGACHRALRPGGLYLANVGDKEGLRLSREELAGMTQHFRHVGAIAGRDMLAGREYGNIVLVGTDGPLPSQAKQLQLLDARARRD